MTTRFIGPDDFAMLTIFGGSNDGKRADSLRLPMLLRELQRMNIPNIKSTMTKPELLATMKAEAIRIVDDMSFGGEMRSKVLSEGLARRAAEAIAARA